MQMTLNAEGEMTVALRFPGQAMVVPEARIVFVRMIQDALRLRQFEVAPDDAFSAWSAYSATAGWPWARVPEDTYDVLMCIRPYLCHATDDVPN